MITSDSLAKLCKVCSTLDIQHLTHPIQPCRNPLPCSTPPKRKFGAQFALGSISEVKSRRSTCDICKLVAECLDKEPSDLDGACRVIESSEFCNFKLPTDVQAQDPSITHFHFTQASVIFDTSEANQFHGPALPWDLKARDTRANHYILDFQVKARSAADVGGTALASEHGFLSTIGGRYVTTHVDAQLIRAWLHQCENEHGKDCMPSLRLPAEGDKDPTFVVDVVQSCLVDTPPRCRYVALSYVWGKDRVFTHLQENTQTLRKVGSLHSLPIPATIRDAITIVGAIKERYLWVDSICITQDDLMMQQAEIMRMGSIYSRALFTIIAAAGSHANNGLAGVESGTRAQVQRTLKLANCELLTVIDIRRTPSGIDGTVWAQRAWTFQEKVLSNRVLVFSENQVYWNCRAASHSEERALEKVRDIDRRHLSFPQKFAADCLSWEAVEPLEYCDLYDDLLSSYRQRRMTYQTDVLNAFSGVAEILAGLQSDAFIWGHPESLFSYAMTWFFTGYSERNHVEVLILGDGGSKMKIPVPSWSWAAWSGKDPDNPPFLHGGDSTHVRPVIHFEIVNKKLELVKIKERSWSDHPIDGAHTLWKDKQHRESPPNPTSYRIGQLCFWTSLANLEAIRRWRVEGPGAVEYIPFPPPGFKPNPNSTHYRTELVHQDFIVIAASGRNALILLAIEWKDGVAYRVGQTDVKEAEWVAVDRQWRFITLG